MQHRRSRDLYWQSQNFLRSAALVDRLLDRSAICRGDLVLDLGAGNGLITRRLAARACVVIAVERDARLVAQLRREFAGVRNIQVRDCDILRLNLPRTPYKVFANIPFNMTATIIRQLTRTALPPEEAFLIVQREAAERFTGQPLTTLVSVLLFPWFEASLFHAFWPSDFGPMPHVEVVMLRLHKRGPPLVAPVDAQLFRDFVVHLFTARNASLSDSLGQLLGHRRGRLLARAADALNAPPSSVSTYQWLDLFRTTRQVVGEDLKRSVLQAEGRLHAQQQRLRKIHRTRSRRVRPPPHACRETEASTGFWLGLLDLNFGEAGARQAVCQAIGVHRHACVVNVQLAEFRRIDAVGAEQERTRAEYAT